MKKLVTVFLLAVVALAFCPAVGLADIGQIKTLNGQVTIIRGEERIDAQPGDVLHPSDVIETGPDSSVGITFIDNSRFSAGPNTRLSLSMFRFNPTTQEGAFVSGVDRGTLTVISGQIAKRSPEAMKIKTPTTILGFRGTRVAIKVTD